MKTGIWAFWAAVGLAVAPQEALGQEEELEAARAVRAEAADLLKEAMPLVLKSFEEGQESHLSVLHLQSMLIEAQQLDLKPTIEVLEALQGHLELATNVEKLVRHRFGAGLANHRDVLSAKANALLRKAAYEEALVKGNAEVVEIMKRSIRNREIREFRFDQVVKWEGAGLEEIEGTTYLTGKAIYEAETIFGPKRVAAKALIRDGKVVRWVYDKTGMRIK